MQIFKATVKITDKHGTTNIQKTRVQIQPYEDPMQVAVRQIAYLYPGMEDPTYIFECIECKLEKVTL